MLCTKKAIIIGATSGIGKALAEVFLAEGYAVGLAGRRVHLIQPLMEKHPEKVFIKRIDVTRTDEAMEELRELIAQMQGADVIVISSGTGFRNKELSWSPEKETIDVNVSGFSAMANVALRYFFSKGSGHFVGISSIASIRGDSHAPAYNASKAFVSNYMEGLRKMAKKSSLPIFVTDIQPGFVDTAMAKGEGVFWVAPVHKAARQIYRAIRKKKPRAYVTKRWRLIALLLKALPESIYSKI